LRIVEFSYRLGRPSLWCERFRTMISRLAPCVRYVYIRL
jgi:hypothetical protein